MTVERATEAPHLEELVLPRSVTAATVRGGTLLEAPSRTVLVTPGVRAASDWAWRLAAIVGAGYFLLMGLAKFSEILIPVLLALLLAALLTPLSRQLTKVMPRGLASILSLVIGLAVVVGLFYIVGRQTISGFTDLSQQAGGGLTKLQDSLRTGPFKLDVNLDQYVNKLETFANDNRTKLLTGAYGVATTATHVVEGFFICMFSTFFFLSSGHRIWAWVLRIFPTAAREPLDRAGKSGWTTLYYYVRATLIVAVVDGLGVGIGAAVLGVPLAIPLGVVVFFGAFIPIVGALITGFLAILVAFVSHGTQTALIMLGIVIAVNQLEAHVLQPFLLGRAVELHPLGVILSLAAGSTLAGIPGALFAVPTVAVLNTMVSSLFGKGHDPAQKASATTGPLAPPDPPGAPA